MIRFGLIGTGKIAENFYLANRFGREFALTAVYSRSMERARAFGAGKGKLCYFDDLEAFAASDAFDAVYLASPNCCHHDQAIALMSGQANMSFAKNRWRPIMRRLHICFR